MNFSSIKFSLLISGSLQPSVVSHVFDVYREMGNREYFPPSLQFSREVCHQEFRSRAHHAHTRSLRIFYCFRQPTNAFAIILYARIWMLRLTIVVLLLLGSFHSWSIHPSPTRPGWRKNQWAWCILCCSARALFLSHWVGGRSNNLV